MSFRAFVCAALMVPVSALAQTPGRQGGPPAAPGYFFQIVAGTAGPGRFSRPWNVGAAAVWPRFASAEVRVSPLRWN